MGRKKRQRSDEGIESEGEPRKPRQGAKDPKAPSRATDSAEAISSDNDQQQQKIAADIGQAAEWPVNLNFNSYDSAGAPLRSEPEMRKDEKKRKTVSKEDKKLSPKKLSDKQKTEECTTKRHLDLIKTFHDEEEEAKKLLPKIPEEKKIPPPKPVVEHRMPEIKKEVTVQKAVVQKEKRKREEEKQSSSSGDKDAPNKHQQQRELASIHVDDKKMVENASQKKAWKKKHGITSSDPDFNPFDPHLNPFAPNPNPHPAGDRANCCCRMVWPHVRNAEAGMLLRVLDPINGKCEIVNENSEKRTKRRDHTQRSERASHKESRSSSRVPRIVRHPPWWLWLVVLVLAIGFFLCIIAIASAPRACQPQKQQATDDE